MIRKSIPRTSIKISMPMGIRVRARKNRLENIFRLERASKQEAYLPITIIRRSTNARILYEMQEEKRND